MSKRPLTPSSSWLTLPANQHGSTRAATISWGMHFFFPTPAPTLGRTWGVPGGWEKNLKNSGPRGCFFILPHTSRPQMQRAKRRLCHANGRAQVHRGGPLPWPPAKDAPLRWDWGCWGKGRAWRPHFGRDARQEPAVSSGTGGD